MPAKQEHLINWLRDAHAMEQQSAKMLEGLIDRVENYPDLTAKLQEHLQQTNRQREQLERCLDRFNAKPSTVKDIGSKLMAIGQTWSGVPVSDEVVKGAMSTYIFENMEIASYTILMQAAQDLGESEVAQICRELLAEEVRMAEWLLEHLKPLTTAFLQRADAPDVNEKR